MTLPNNTIFEFYEGTETSKYTELNSTTLNTAPSQLLENDKYLDQEVQSLKEFIEDGEIEIQPSQLPEASDTQQGIIEIATQEEVSAGTGNTTAVTPAYNKVFVDTQVTRAKQEVKDEALEEIGPVVDEKIETAIGEAQDEIDNKIDQVIQDRIESGEIGGGGGGGSSTLVLKPEIITPTEGASNVASLPTLQASAFKCLLTTETRLHREFELNTVTPDANVVTKQVNADSVTLDSKLNPNTQYKWRCRDVTVNRLYSAWTAWTNFTTAEGQTVTTPTITLKGYQNSPTDILSGLTIEGSAFAVSEGSDTHKATSWFIAKKVGARSNVWESLNDTVHKTSITVPDGTLEKSTAYTLTVIYHGTAAYDSAPAVVDFTTSADFGTVNAPTLTVEGQPSSVFSNPTLTGGVFSNTRDPDTHDKTDWLIVPSSGGEPVWESLNNTANKTSIKVPNNTLQTGTAYTAKVRYHGAKFGWSAYTENQFSTLATFATINTPTLTVQGTPNDVPRTPKLTLSNFSGTNNATFASTNWKVVKVQDSSEVWNASNKSNTIIVPAGKLEVSTDYKFQAQYVSNEGAVSAWAETLGRTANSFIIPDSIGFVSDGTFGVGFAPEKVYKSLGLSPLPGTEDPKSFQYGLYEKILPEETGSSSNIRRQCKAYVKYIPKFYYAFLTDYTTGQLKTEETLREYERYSGISLELLKQAQQRSPNHAIVIAPGSAFASQEEANEHGFILHRAFIDGGKEMPGFFIANSLLYYSASSNELNTDTKYYYYFGAKELNHYEYDLTESRTQGIVRLDGITPPMSSNFGDSNTVKDAITLCRKFNGFNVASIFMWSAISMLSFAAGLYCKDETECAWYKTSGNIGPRGNNSGTKDADDPTVTFITISGTSGTPFPSDSGQYAKTTHNGTISGITNVNGWLYQLALGTNGKYTKVMPESTVLANITSIGTELSNGETFEGSSSGKWGESSSSRSTTWFTQTSGAERAMCGVAPLAKEHPVPEAKSERALFGTDNFTHINGDDTSFSYAGGYGSNYTGAGIFSRDFEPYYYEGDYWSGVRLGGYPRDYYIATPTVTIDGGTVNVGETPVLRGSAFAIEPSGSDTHVSTNWKIVLASDADGAPVWESTSDTVNKTEITVPKGRLQTSTSYIAMVQYNGQAYGLSEWAQYQFSTAAVFSIVNTPTLTVAGAPNAVAEQPALTLSAFGGTNVTYKSSHFKILKNADNSKVWETTSASSSVKVPKSTLEVSTTYKFQGWYESNEGVMSQVAEVVATTVAEFSPVAAPNIVVEQDELGVYEAPLITATAFINESGIENDDHSATDWVVLNASDGTEVWSSKSDRGHLRAIQMPNGKLQPNTTYRVQVRYQAYISGWGPWNEVEVTTQETFYNANLPTLQNANLDRAGTQLRFEFSTDQLYVRPSKPRPTHLRVKVRNNTKADFVDTFTTPINNQGNYILLRDTTYDLDAADDIEYQVFYKGDASENDDNPYSATATRPATVNENILVLLESISGGQHHVYQYPTITISLNYGPQTFTHTKTDWQIRDVADSTTIWSSMGDTTNLTKIKCPIKLDRQTFYTLKIKAYGTRDTDQNAESIEFVMTILTSAGGDIGVPGQMGFGIGLYDGEDLEQLGLTLMEGGADPNNDNYGNYQHTNGSVFCFVPAFCYSFTDEDANLSSKGTPNAFYVRSFTEFEDEADAKQHGYTLHRAFIDGGQTKKGFFIAKYLMGKGCKATKGNIPISLVGTGSSDASSQAEGGTGQAWDALTLSKKLGSQYNCASCFMYSALAMLSYCHGLYAEAADTCAWYDAAQTTNFPKGCNNNALGDTNDVSVKYTNSDTKNKQKPNTGSATPFAKTTHNGQNSGVCDLNGCIWQATTGVLLYNATLYLSPDSAKFTDFTKDNVQTTGNTALYTNLGSVSTYYKNGNWGVAGQCSFRKENSGVQRALNGVLPLPAGTGSGTNEFGKDQAYLYADSHGHYSALWCSGYWYDTSDAGVWFRYLYTNWDNYSSWSDSYAFCGFRSAAYGAV